MDFTGPGEFFLQELNLRLYFRSEVLVLLLNFGFGCVHYCEKR